MIGFWTQELEVELRRLGFGLGGWVLDSGVEVGLRWLGFWALGLGFRVCGWGLDSGIVGGAQGLRLNLGGWVLDSGVGD